MSTEAIRRHKSHPGLAIVQTRLTVSFAVLLLARFTSAFEEPAQVSWIILGYMALNLSFVLLWVNRLKQKRVRMMPILFDLAAISLLVMVTGGLGSSWYVLYLFPVLSASRYLGPIWTLAVAVFAMVAYGFVSLVLAHHGVLDTVFWLRVLTLGGVAFTAANLARTRDRDETKLVSAIEQIDREILGDTELQGVMRSILNATMAITDSDLSAVALFEGERMTTVLSATRFSEKDAPASQEEEAEARRLLQQHCRRVLDSGQPLSLPANRARALGAILRRAGDRAGCWPARLVPLGIDQTHFGVLAIFSRRVLHYYTPNDREKLSSMVSLAAIAHKNATRFRELAAREKEGKERLHLLYDIAKQLKAEQGLDRLFQSVVNVVSTRLGSEEAALFIADERGTRIQKVAVSGPEDEIEKKLATIELSYGWGQSLSGKVFASKDPLLLPTIPPGEQYVTDYSDHLPSGTTRHYLGVPLLIGEEVLGVIRVLNKKASDYRPQRGSAGLEKDGFSKDDLELISLIATQVASAIRNAQFIERTRYLGQLVYNSPDAIIIIDKNGKIQNFNKECEKLWGLSEQEVLGTSVEKYYESPEHAREIGRALWNSEGHTIRDYRARIRDSQGNIIPIRLSATLLLDKNGQKIGSMSVFKDEREIVRQEDKRLRDEKLAALGRLAQTTGHDIKTDLGTIQNWVDTLEVDADPDSLQAYLAIREAITKARNKLQNMLMAVKPNPPEKNVFSLRSFLINFETSVMDEALVTQIGLSLGYPPCDALVLADAEQIRQVFANLFRNSLDAIKVKKATLSKENRALGRIDVSFEIEGDTIALSWRDNGCGMSEDARLNAFVPFFTTKENGSGLGLFITKTIVENHGGKISVESANGNGVCFHITLPLFHTYEGGEAKPS